MRKSVVGHTCMVCGAIGLHFEDSCPHKERVGMPEAFRAVVHDSTVAVVRAVHHFPPEYLEPRELLPLLCTSKHVPSGLRCVSCDALARESIWCANCDSVICSACMGPPCTMPVPADCASCRSPLASEQWACPNCRCIDHDAFYVVGALRSLATLWLEHAVQHADSLETK